MLSFDGVLAPNLKVAINKRNRASHGRRLCCRDFSPSRRGDILGFVTRGLPYRIFGGTPAAFSPGFSRRQRVLLLQAFAI
jgi:hypothetical protein